MKAKDFRIDQDYSFDHFMELTKTGITYNAKNLDQFAEDYYQAKLNLLTIPVVSNCTDWVVDYRDYDGSISKTVITGTDEDDVICKFISDYEGLEWTTIKKVV